MSMELKIKRFEDLTGRELYEILRARAAVFVVEQACPYQDLDGKDFVSWHVWLEDEEGLQAYVRVLPAGVSFSEVSIGRVITVKRGAGLGLQIMQAGIRVAEEKFGPGPIRIGAQKYARGFYEKVGFRQASDDFLEDGIVHVEMLREAAAVAPTIE